MVLVLRLIRGGIRQHNFSGRYRFQGGIAVIGHRHGDEPYAEGLVGDKCPRCVGQVNNALI
jgi:hypothetical protein